MKRTVVLIAGAALGLAALGACSAKKGTSGGGEGAGVAVGGSGGAAGSGGAGGATAGSGGSGGTTTTTHSGGAGGGGPCVGCKDRMGHPNLTVCAGQSSSLWQAYDGCSCQDGGHCASGCGDNFCLGQAMSYACQQCMYDPVLGCGNEYNACLNDT